MKDNTSRNRLHPTNKYNTTLYTGVTRDLQKRIAEHKLHINKGFSSKYNTEKLVYYEVYDRLEDGIHREKQLKKWHRGWKEKLINDFNPEWKDLAESIGVDAEYLQAVKDAYECGQYVPGDSGSSPHSGLDPESHEIAGQARDEERGSRDEERGSRDEERGARDEGRGACDEGGKA